MDFLCAKKENAALPSILLGKVVANYDDNYQGMVQVAFYSYNEKANTTDWMRVISPMAGKNKGMYFLPEVGDEVVVAFINNDINNPCVIGVLWNESDTYPAGAVTKENTSKVIATKSGIQILFCDEAGKESVKISAPNKTEIIISGEHDSIVIKDSKGKNKIEVNGETANITIQSDGKLDIKAKEIEIKAEGTMKLEALGVAELKGRQVKINE